MAACATLAKDPFSKELRTGSVSDLRGLGFQNIPRLYWSDVPNQKTASADAGEGKQDAREGCWLPGQLLPLFPGVQISGPAQKPDVGAGGRGCVALPKARSPLSLC